MKNRSETKKRIISIVFLSGFFFLFPQFILSEKAIDISKFGYLLDNRFVPVEEIIHKDSLGMINCLGFFPSLRDVLLYLGESYRNLEFVYVFESHDAEIAN